MFQSSLLNTKVLFFSAILLSVLNLTACGGGANNSTQTNAEAEPAETEEKNFQLRQGQDNNQQINLLLSLNPGGPGGSPNQSLRAGDVLQGDDGDDIIIGGLGVDTLIGQAGDDILIGGTEDFNSSVDGDSLGSDNRDRALGNAGDDVFIWAPQ